MPSLLKSAETMEWVPVSPEGRAVVENVTWADVRVETTIRSKKSVELRTDENMMEPSHSLIYVNGDALS